MKLTNSMAAELFWAFGCNEGTNKKIKTTSFIQGILKLRKSLKWKGDNSKYWLNDYIVGLQYLVHGGDKCNRSVFHYLSQSNGFDLSEFGHQFFCVQKWLPISKSTCILPRIKDLSSTFNGIGNNCSLFHLNMNGYHNSMSNHWIFLDVDTLTFQILFIFSLFVDNVEMINPENFSPQLLMVPKLLRSENLTDMGGSG